MKRVVAYDPCPKCRANGKDSRGDNLVVYSDGGYHCFSCGNHRSPQRFVPKEEVPNVSKALLPADFTREVPANAWKWLLQWGLPYQYWLKKVGFSPKENRLIFLVGEPTVFSLGRYLGEDKGPKKWYVWGDPHRHCEVVGDGEKIVLVEDLLSAHKVGQVTTAIPLFGVNYHPPHLYYLMNDARPVVLWLDKDQEGEVKKKAVKLSMLLNKAVDVLITDKDPKEYSVDEISRYVSEPS